jgi:glycosyltransferase involved in cell wall biosynthesis
LAEWLGRPLVVDLRDPWTYGSLWRPKTERIADLERAWAARVFGRASRIICTSPLTLATMHERFPQVPRERWVTITNGFDDVQVAPLRGVPEDICLFRYVGMLNERRRPDVLIQAYARAAEDPEFRDSSALELIGNAGGHESKVSLAPGCNVRFLGHVSRAESLRYMFGSDVNVLLQTISEGQDVVSGKAFDYLHARKPMLAVVDEAGGDAWFMRETGAGRVAPWSDVAAIAAAMRQSWLDFKAGTRSLDPRAPERYSRRGLAAQLAVVLDDVLARR